MRKNLLLLVGGLVFGLLIGAGIFWVGNLDLGPTPEDLFTLEQGKPVPDLSLPILDGEDVNISALRGKVVVLNFWATWCTPCREEMPLLQRYSDEYSDQLAVIGINVDYSLAEVRSFLMENSIRFPIVNDNSELKLTEKFRVRGYPSTFFIDEKGVLRGTQIGLLDETLLSQQLKNAGMELP